MRGGGDPRPLGARRGGDDRGDDLSCSISTAGAAECWGTNTLAALGSGTAVQKSYDPLGVAGLGTGVSDITSGTYSGCAIQSGAAKCWGNNQNGQAGDGTVTTAGVPPTQVSGLTSGVTRISSGDVTTARSRPARRSAGAATTATRRGRQR